MLFFYYIANQTRFRELTRSEAQYVKIGSAPPVKPLARTGSPFAIRPRIVEKHELIADNLNTRVLSLQARATMIYWTILLTLGTGVILVIFSGYLSSLDTASNFLWSRLDGEMAKVYPLAGGTATDPEIVKKFDDHYNKILDSSIADVAARNNQGRVWNWPSTVMRVSIAGLLIFLVQILIQLYRYNSRLIAFYSSRRDAIIMSAGEIAAAKEWEAVFAPKNLDFGREPRHPFQAIAQLFGRGKFSDERAEAADEGAGGSQKVQPDQTAQDRQRKPRQSSGEGR
jgi:hypothetical protein